MPQLVRDGRGLHADRRGELVTEQGPACSRPRMRSRLGVASACMVSATARAKSVIERGGVVCLRMPCAINAA